MKLIRIAAVAIAALSFSISSTASAQTGLHYRATYYSDSQKTEVVGYTLIWCDWTATGNGYLTPYYDEEWYDC